MGQQHRRGLGADPGHARDVVDRVAAQREVVGDLVRLDAVARTHVRRAPALAAGEVPLLVVAVEQLRQVLVRRHDHAAVAMRARLVQRAADQVVGL